MIPFSNSTFFYLALAFISLCGFGVVFLNAESILALCFFIFLALMVHYSDPISQNLDEIKKGILSELTLSLIQAGAHNLQLRSSICEKKGQLLNSTKSMTSIASEKAQAAFSNGK